MGGEDIDPIGEERRTAEVRGSVLLKVKSVDGGAMVLGIV